MMFEDSIQWNFAKFLVDKNGKYLIAITPQPPLLALRPSCIPDTVCVSVYFDKDYKMASQANIESIYDLTVKDAKGNDVNLRIYKGKVLLIVNVASQCGFTDSNYTELNQLYAKYKYQGLEILAFPCNQFGGQEPGSNEQILDFACTRFKAEFPIFDKIDVNGENTSPVYKVLKAGFWTMYEDNIQWNFAKFLVDKNGNVTNRYYPTTSPLSIEHDIKKLLGI